MNLKDVLRGSVFYAHCPTLPNTDDSEAKVGSKGTMMSHLMGVVCCHRTKLGERGVLVLCQRQLSLITVLLMIPQSSL